MFASIYLQAQNSQNSYTGTVQSTPDNRVNFEIIEQITNLPFNGSGILDLVGTDGDNFLTDNKKSLQNYSSPISESSDPKFNNAETSLIFSEDFESGVMTLPRSGNYPTITTSPVRAGNYAMKTYLHYKNSQDNYRTEVYLKQKDNIGDHYWYGFSIFLPNDYIVDNVWEIVAQWHGVPDFDIGENWRYPILALKTEGGVWRVRNIWDASSNTFSSGEESYDGVKRWTLGNYETGKWVDWVFHIKWSYLSDGILEVWKDGKLVITRNGPNCYNDELGPYFKMGMYKGWKEWWLNTWSPDVALERTLYHDELRIAHGQDGYELVSVGGNILPLVLKTEIVGNVSQCESYVKITAQGGIPPYILTVDGSVVNGFVTETVLTLDAGTHNIVVTDSQLGSNAVATVEVVCATCDLAVETNVVQGECSSVVEIVVTGGVAPYKVTVNGFEVTDMVQTRAAGSYKIVATDANLVCVAETIIDIVNDPVNARTATDTTLIGERVEFFDSESGIDTMLGEGMHTLNYTYEGCDRTLIVTIFGVQPLTIIEVQGEDDTSPWLSAVVKVAGTVTHVVNGTGFFMQDANAVWSGIWVTSTETIGILEGNGVEVTGTVVENLNYIYFDNVTTINAIKVNLVNSGLTVEAIVVASAFEAKKEKYESVFVKVKSARALAVDITTGAWVIHTEDSIDIVVNDWLFSYTPTIGNLYNVSGVINGQGNNYKLEPRKDVDVVDLTTSSVYQTLINEQFKVYPNPFNDKIYIDNSDKLTRVVVINIAGQRVIDVEYPGHEIRTDNLVSGIYVVSMFTENGISKTVKIVKK